jgi:hypothetical protein
MGLWLDSEFSLGHTHRCPTYLSPPLVPEESFKVAVVECYGFVVPSNFYLLPSDSQDEAAPSVLANKQVRAVCYMWAHTVSQNLFMLDLLGKNYSEGERPE